MRQAAAEAIGLPGPRTRAVATAPLRRLKTDPTESVVAAATQALTLIGASDD